jgi:Ca2+-binding RTX toxin-like protein
MYGKADNDVLQGRLANDRLYGNSGDDNLEGGLGGDELYAGRGDDVVFEDKRPRKLNEIFILFFSLADNHICS